MVNLWAAFFLMIFCWAATASEAPALEYPVKAAFLYNLVKFVNWPSDPGRPIVLGVLNKGPFDVTLRQMVQGKSLDRRPILVRRITRVEEARSCQLIFIDETESERLAALLAVLKGFPVLTVGSIEQFAGRGGMIYLITGSSKVRFEANIDKLSSAGIKISARFLQLAVIVRNRDREGRQ